MESHNKMSRDFNFGFIFKVLKVCDNKKLSDHIPILLRFTTYDNYSSLSKIALFLLEWC